MTQGPVSRPPRRVAAAVLLILCAACDGDITGNAPVCGEEPAVSLGVPMAGELRGGDDRLAGAFVDYYSLELPDTARLVVTLTSTELDPLLLLLDSGGAVVDQAFDPLGTAPGVEETASMTRTFTPGCHLLGASAWTPDTTGAYILLVIAAAPR